MDIKPLITAEQIDDKLREIGRQISEDYAGKEVLLVGVLRGAFMVMADLARHIDLPCEFDFMAVSSYGASTQTSGVVRILKDLDEEIEGRHVIIVEDIIDSGLTLNYLMKSLRVRRPESLEIATLLLKEGIQRVPIGQHVRPWGRPRGDADPRTRRATRRCRRGARSSAAARATPR